MTNLGITGCGGRMGRMLAAEISRTADCRVAAGCEAPGSPALGHDIGELAGIGAIGIIAGADAETCFAASDAVIDFSTPEAALGFAAVAARHGKPLVLGSAGFTPAQYETLREVAKRTVIVDAPDSSIAANLLMNIVEQVARRLGENYDVEIVDFIHHRNNEAPTVTALGLGAAAAAGRGVELENRRQHGRDGSIEPRRKGDIGFASLRGGETVGDHTVIFAGAGDRIELTHRAFSRDIYARGAIAAALWALKQQPGFYTMRDVAAL